MKVVYLNPIGRLGGAEVLLLDLMFSMRQARPEWQLHLVVPEAGIVAERASVLGVEVHVVPMPAMVARLGDAGTGRGWARLSLLLRLLQAFPAAVWYRWRLAGLLSRLQPDILHSNGLKMHLLSVWSRPPGAKVIWHLQDFLSGRPVMARLLRCTASGCSVAIAVSNHVREDLRSVCPALPAEMVWNALDLDEFSPEGPACDLDLLSELPPAGDAVRIGLVAAMARWKGHKVFLEAVAKMHSGAPVRAYVVGDAIYHSSQSQWQIEELRSLARHLNLSSRVGFTGFVGRPSEVYRALDIVVHASTEAEPFGLVIAEAMSCGKAVVASSFGGPREFVQDGTNGLMHEAGNAEDLARKLDALVEDAALRARLGSEARATAVRRFDRGRLAAEVIPVYESVRAD